MYIKGKLSICVYLSADMPTNFTVKANAGNSCFFLSSSNLNFAIVFYNAYNCKVLHIMKNCQSPVNFYCIVNSIL